MSRSRFSLFCLATATAFMLLAQPARAALDPEDQKLIDAATCPEIVEEYKGYLAAEKELDAEIKRAKAGQTAANIAGLAALATLGLGFFTYDDDSSAQENLAELREIRQALAAGARKKKCVLPR